MSQKQLFFHCLSRFRYSESKKLRTPTNLSPVPEGRGGGEDKNLSRYLSSALRPEGQGWVLLPAGLSGR